MTDTLSGPPANRKPTHWDDLKAVPTVTLPDGTSTVEAMGAIGYGWDATSSTFVKLLVDHATGALQVTGSGGGGGGGVVQQGAQDVATVQPWLVDIASQSVGSVAVTAPLGGAVDVNIKTITASGGTPAVQANIPDGLDSNAGTTTDAANTTGTTGTMSGKLRGLVSLINARMPALGQTTASASAAVVLASDKQVIAGDVTDALYNGTTALTPKFLAVTASASGVTNLLALVSSHRIRVVALALTSNGTVNVKFQSHVTPTDLTGLFYLIANSGFVLPYNPLGWFQTVSGEALDINLSASVAVGGLLQYVEV